MHRVYYKNIRHSLSVIVEGKMAQNVVSLSLHGNDEVTYNFSVFTLFSLRLVGRTELTTAPKKLRLITIRRLSCLHSENTSVTNSSSFVP